MSKTISMPLEEYELELKRAETRGKKIGFDNGSERMAEYILSEVFDPAKTWTGDNNDFFRLGNKVVEKLKTRVQNDRP